MITVIKSRTLMEINLPSLFSDLNRRVRCFTSSGKSICHQKPSLMEYLPAPSRQLSPNDNAVGVCGITCAIGVFHIIPEFRRSLSRKNSISCHIDLFIINLISAWWTSLAPFSEQIICGKPDHCMSKGRILCGGTEQSCRILCMIPA